MAPPLSVIKIVKYCDVWGGGWALARQNITKNIGVPLSLSLRLLSIVTSVEGGGGIGGRQNPTKNNGAPSLCY